jgi:glycosyltransferase involved in cell wall biosynthesis
MVVSIHDVSFAAHPEWFGWREGVRRRLLARLTVRRAARVLTLTRFSRDEIVAHLGADPDTIDITYAGVSALAGGSTPNDAAPPDGAALREPRVLFVGSILERRHVPELIAGFGRLASRRPETHLDIVGDQRATPPVDLDAASAATGARDRIHVRAYISDSELAECYQRAGVFAWLSSYEGFGLTPLEALAARIPIVVLDTAVAREVYGDAAIYVPAPRPDLIDAALERALFDPAERQRVLTASRALLERYSWKRVAAIVLEALLTAGR